MPYLTQPDIQPAVSAGELRLGVPGYAHPLLAPREWEALPSVGAGVHWTVLNVADGPGERPDPHCLEAAGRLRNAQVRVVGQLDLAGGQRSFGALLSDAHRFRDWYLVDGFYLDRCPTERAALPELRRVVGALRDLLGGGHLVTAHGTHPHPGYAEVADQLVTFSGPWHDYRWSQAPEWTAAYPPERFCHLVHGLPRGHLTQALRIARWQGAGTIWFTDRTAKESRSACWETMPGYWDALVSQVGTGVSE
ncbi:spherulation-specific family 4 protein [Streptomyces albidoflavus]